jgi:D-beta-D-heptose 7-phosphate kinase/D-beta-D-heptose 1-phosphate adenosyltransferase
MMPSTKDKIKDLKQLKKIISHLKSEGKKIVFTNGCFDLLHYGHIKYLERAKSFGDILIVAVNSDSSMKRLKGENRPINNQRDRAMVLASLEFVDFVTIFEDLTPYRLISNLRPDYLIKGGDWRKEDIVGKDLVEAYGGKVRVIPFVKNYSTTNLIRRIIQKFG